MIVPAIRGVIARRLLINYRIDPSHLSKVLPDPFEPLLVDGYGVGGICLIRLTGIKPATLPGSWGLTSENGAHRIAVRLADGTEAVYIPRRDTDSRLNTLLGGRLFPGAHHHARFSILETHDRMSIRVRGDDGKTRVEVSGKPTGALPPRSVFGDTQTASNFFERGSLGYSDTSDPARFDALELKALNWSVTPLEVDHVFSSFFEDPERFPRGSVEFDDALLMQNIDHEWRAQESLYCSGVPEARSV
jgi:hypothetical protein